jgi:hypothetical protein
VLFVDEVISIISGERVRDEKAVVAGFELAQGVEIKNSIARVDAVFLLFDGIELESLKGRTRRRVRHVYAISPNMYLRPFHKY